MLKTILLLTLGQVLSAAPPFSAQRTKDHGIEIVRLADTAREVQVSVVPSIGNREYELRVKGKNLLYFPRDLADFASNGGMGFNGIPFLAPWGNRIPGGGFWANGKRYNFNTTLGNLSLDRTGIAIHGMLTTSPLWEVIDVAADQQSAHVTSRLRFWKYPELMANWPFAHEYEMTYRLSDKGLEVETVIRNLGAEPMPVVIGYHPYFNIPDVPRPDWSIRVPAKKHVEMDSQLVATGSLTDSGLADKESLRSRTFDDGYTDLVRDEAGNATLAVEGGGKKIEVIFGPKFKVALVYAPPRQTFVCFEPMAAITNGINLAHEGKYDALQSVAPNAEWRESFWVRFHGF